MQGAKCHALHRVYSLQDTVQVFHNLNHDLESEEKKQDTFKNWPLIKNSQFFSHPHETW